MRRSSRAISGRTGPCLYEAANKKVSLLYCSQLTQSELCLCYIIGPERGSVKKRKPHQIKQLSSGSCSSQGKWSLPLITCSVLFVVVPSFFQSSLPPYFTQLVLGVIPSPRSPAIFSLKLNKELMSINNKHTANALIIVGLAERLLSGPYLFN